MTNCEHCGFDGDWHTSHHASCPNRPGRRQAELARRYRELEAAEARLVLVPQPLQPIGEIGLNAIFNSDKAFWERNR